MAKSVIMTISDKMANNIIENAEVYYIIILFFETQMYSYVYRGQRYILYYFRTHNNTYNMYDNN